MLFSARRSEGVAIQPGASRVDLAVCHNLAVCGHRTQDHLAHLPVLLLVHQAGGHAHQVHTSGWLNIYLNIWYGSGGVMDELILGALRFR